MATLVGTRGANRKVAKTLLVSVCCPESWMQELPSVTMPSVPSAPIKSLVVSKPAEDLRARRRVLITLPEGRTTV
jgi:hypothetical protein